MPTSVFVRVYCTTTGLTGPAAIAAEKHRIDRGYRERLRVLSDGLASTQLQLATLKSNRSKLAALEVEARCAGTPRFIMHSPMICIKHLSRYLETGLAPRINDAPISIPSLSQIESSLRCPQEECQVEP